MSNEQIRPETLNIGEQVSNEGPLFDPGTIQDCRPRTPTNRLPVVEKPSPVTVDTPTRAKRKRKVKTPNIKEAVSFLPKLSYMEFMLSAERVCQSEKSIP